MQRKNVNEIADIVIKNLKDVFEDGVNNICLEEVVDEPGHDSFEVTFSVYNYYYMEFEYYRGSIGACIIYGEFCIDIETDQEWVDGTDFIEFWREVQENIKLRIPDKYLEYHGWL